MPNSPDQFDFSKPDDQQRFEQFPKEEQEAFIVAQHEEALKADPLHGRTNEASNESDKAKRETIGEEEQQERREIFENATVLIWGKEYRIPARVSEFEYPEQRKEPGVIGYKRTKIDREDLAKLMDKIYEDMSSSIENGEKIPIPISVADKLSEPSLETILHREARDEILQSLSHGEYPDQCFCHTIGGNANQRDRDTYKKQLVEDRFFLQKILDVDSIEKLKKTNAKLRPFEHNYGEYWDLLVSLFDKKTDVLIKKDILPSKIPDYLDYIKSNQAFMASTTSGFNTRAHELYTKWLGGDIFEATPSFGFYPDSFLKSYLLKALEKGKEIAVANGGLREDAVVSERFVKGILWVLNPEGPPRVVARKQGLTGPALGDFEDKYYEELTRKYGVTTQWRLGQVGIDPDEACIPIFINSDEVPQLCWGHAKYASYCGSKSFNLIEFKHEEPDLGSVFHNNTP